MRDRLIELIGKNLMDYASWQTEMALAGNYDMPSVEEVIVDKLLNDGWMKPPCNVGDKLYKPWQAGGRKVVVTYKVMAIQSSRKGEWVVVYKGKDSLIAHRDNIREIGKTLFLSKEEVEQALKGGAE